MDSDLDYSDEGERMWDDDYDYSFVDEQQLSEESNHSEIRNEIRDTEGGTRQVIFSHHATNAVKGMKELRDDGELLDLALKVASGNGQEVIVTHGCILAAHSPFIRAFLRNEGKDKEVDLSNWHKEAISTLIDWVYDGVLKIHHSNCYELLESSDYLCLSEVSQECASYIIHNLTLENCCEAFMFSYRHQIPNFKDRVKKYILSNFADLLKGNHLLPLPKDTFLTLLKDDNLMLLDEFGFPVSPHEEEMTLLNLLKNYINSNKMYDLWPTLLEHVIRFGVMQRGYLEHLLTTDFYKWLKNCNEKEWCQSFLNNLKSLLSSGKDLSLVNNHWGRCRETLQKIGYFWTRAVASSSSFPSQGNDTEFDDLGTILDSLKKDGKPPLVFIVGMKLYTNVWDNHTVVSTIEVTYNTGATFLHGHVRDGLDPHEFNLKPGERIVSAKGRSGWLVDRLSFETNLDRKLGPYGGSDGGPRDFEPKHPNSYLAGIKGIVVKSEGYSYIRHIKLAWASFNPK